VQGNPRRLVELGKLSRVICHHESLQLRKAGDRRLIKESYPVDVICISRSLHR
jgi:hypothetical protein